ncbi:hypothetical protein [Cupriavidus taiwanensis]|uniref:Transmembrane protein n=1 Tax=Cupriavidus taiwanensis TaxID=164546 RepID=A0A7Z7JHP6_9BURK|nr:hypothetical protein [Cupriavidus taiwanensis]SOZ17567.1 conserved membrane hypothetical protein [Cupriavidus taiwanensis]SOZ96240.1 conserved membrane hypothetical protein [Cupriavidus taiwanensis]SPC25793.1 conserved membrane hypothetical protein [Cupriavidus taiwanensis]
MSEPHFLPHPPRQAFRIARQRRWALYAVFTLLLVTGIAWLVVRWSVADPETQAPWLAWNMKLHGASALAATFLVGTIWSSHIRHAWSRRRNRFAGGVFGFALGLLLVSGYGLYYFNGDLQRGLAEWMHWIAGLSLALPFWWHLSRGRRIAR